MNLSNMQSKNHGPVHELKNIQQHKKGITSKKTTDYSCPLRITLLQHWVISAYHLRTLTMAIQDKIKLFNTFLQKWCHHKQLCMVELSFKTKSKVYSIITNTKKHYGTKQFGIFELVMLLEVFNVKHVEYC